jgi:hypothetical protein
LFIYIPTKNDINATIKTIRNENPFAPGFIDFDNSVCNCLFRFCIACICASKLATLSPFGLELTLFPPPFSTLAALGVCFVEKYLFKLGPLPSVSLSSGTLAGNPPASVNTTFNFVS